MSLQPRVYRERTALVVHRTEKLHVNDVFPQSEVRPIVPPDHENSVTKVDGSLKSSKGDGQRMPSEPRYHGFPVRGRLRNVLHPLHRSMRPAHRGSSIGAHPAVENAFKLFF